MWGWGGEAVCEQAHGRLKMCSSCVGRQGPQSSGGCLLKTAEREEQLSMAADHFTLQSAVDLSALSPTAL